MSMEIRNSAIVPLTPAADYSAKRGYLVTIAGVTATISASATVPAVGIIVEGGRDINDTCQVGILGAMDGTVAFKTSGVIAAGARVQQAADGTVVTDAGPGNARVVVGVALESAVAGDLIEVAPITPMILP